MDTVKVSSKGQIVIPKALRDARHITAGSEFVITAAGADLILTPAPVFQKTSVKAAAGMLPAGPEIPQRSGDQTIHRQADQSQGQGERRFMIALDTSCCRRSRINTAPPSVLLELVWVLEVNDCTHIEIVKAFSALFGLPNFKPMQFEQVAYALRWYEAGMNFGDAMHLALSAPARGFVTFDKVLVKQARKTTPDAESPVTLSNPKCASPVL